jgi:D-glycero-D-manno-heptose 1,7-bisphosphate phosphatase
MMPINARHRAVLLDRDGTLNEEVRYLHRIEDLVWTHRAGEAVARLNAAGWRVLVVTNQAGVAHGLYTEEDVQALHAFMQEQLRPYHAHIDAFYYCPYHPEARIPAYRQDSPFRKPQPGMYLQALTEWHIDAAQSYVVGDRNADLEPGHLLGMQTILVETGYGSLEKAETRASQVVPDLWAAVDYILGS